jgi:uncharacterized membrane protein
MTRLLLALPLLGVTACATTQPYAPVRDVAYQAIGAAPFWTLAIGDDSIVLRAGNPASERRWPRVLSRTVGEAEIWQSGEGTAAITITARRSDCRSGSGQTYRDQVMIRAGETELTGCGGPLLDGSPR